MRVYSLRDVEDRPFVTSDLLLWPRMLEMPDGTIVAGTGKRFDDPMVEAKRRSIVSDAVRVVRRGLLPLHGTPRRRPLP